MKFVYIFFFWVFKSSFKDLGDVSKSDSSEFGELYCSILESVIYKEYTSLYLFLKSGFKKWVWYLRLQLWKLHFSLILAGWYLSKHA